MNLGERGGARELGEEREGRFWSDVLYDRRLKKKRRFTL